MKHIRLVAIVVGVGAATICCSASPTQTPSRSPTEADRPIASSSSAAPAEQERSHAMPAAELHRSVPDIRAQCALEVRRQIACVDAYIPMIVDVRIKLDLPPGMAEKGRDEAGRAELLDAARQEFPHYYSVEKIPEICEQRQAMAERMPPELLDELEALGPDCHRAEDCAGFARCVAPMVERILALQARATEG